MKNIKKKKKLFFSKMILDSYMEINVLLLYTKMSIYGLLIKV